MKVAEYVIRFLESTAGIGHVFTVCGGGSIFLNDALARAEKLKFVSCHHEQAAAMAAEAYARARTGLGCVMVTSGPGGTNAITGIAGAWTDHVPVICISGQVFQSQTIAGHPGLRTKGVQELPIVDLVRPITKYAVTVTGPDSIRYHLEKAAWLATSGRPGPVWLDIPADVQNADIDPGRLTGFTVACAARTLPEFMVRRVADLLRSAKRPLIHVGQGIRLAGAELALLRFLGASRIPVMTARNGNDLVDSGHELYIGRPGTFAQRGANFAVQACDVYLAIGTRLSLAQTGYNAKDYARNAKVVMVDVDRAELEKDTVPLHLKVQADAREFLEALQNEIFDGKKLDNETEKNQVLPDWSGWLAHCKGLQAKYPPVTDDQRNPPDCVNSYHLIDVLSEQLTPGDQVVTDMGFAFQNTHQAFRVKAGQRLLTNCGVAAMGWGLPAAIGACIGTGRRTICIAGDGGLMFNLQELATLAHHRLPVKIFLLNNGGYLTMRQSQAHAFGRYMGSDPASGISFPSFWDLTEAFGIHYDSCVDPADLAATVSAVLARPGPAVCEIVMDVDQPQVPKSVNRRLEDGSISQTAIEDAWPHLPREEIAANLHVAGEKS